MRRITKGKEPAALRRHRSKVTADFTPRYSNFQGGDEVRAALLRDQHEVCCYCGKRIKLDKMKIEHWAGQSAHPTLDLKWRNLLGACMGNEGQPKRRQHCDTAKGAADLTLNPLNDIEPALQFNLVDGSLHANRDDWEVEINEHLQLNIDELCTRRLEALEGYKAYMASEHPGRWSRELLQRQIAGLQARTGVRLKPYAPFLIAFLQRKLASL